MIQKGVREQPKISLNIFTLEERFEFFLYIYICVNFSEVREAGNFLLPS